MIEHKAHLGESLGNAFRKAIDIATRENDVVHFSGNGIDFYADKYSIPSLVEEYLDKCYRYNVNSLGPKEPEWSVYFINEKEEEYREYERKLKEEYKRSQEEEEKDYQYFLDFVKDEDIEVNNKERWEEIRNANSDHFYSRTYLYFLEDIAKYLQVIKRLNGSLTKDDVKKGERLIRKHGITGYQHGCVVGTLKEIWKYWEDGFFLKKIS